MRSSVLPRNCKVTCTAKKKKSDIDQRKFHLNLPFEEIKAKVEAERNLLLSKLAEEEKSQV